MDVFATLLLGSRELRVRNGARHDRPSQQEDNEQQSKIDNKLHKRRTITTYGADIHNVRTYLIRSAQQKLQEKIAFLSPSRALPWRDLVHEARRCCSAYLLCLSRFAYVHKTQSPNKSFRRKLACT